MHICYQTVVEGKIKGVYGVALEEIECLQKINK